MFLLSIGGLISSIIGFFWWALAAFLVVVVIFCLYASQELDEVFGYAGIIAFSLIFAIVLGRLVGGFGWVVIGLAVGAALGAIVFLMNDTSEDKSRIIFRLLFPVVIAIILDKVYDSFLLAIMGGAAGLLIVIVIPKFFASIKLQMNEKRQRDEQRREQAYVESLSVREKAEYVAKKYQEENEQNILELAIIYENAAELKKINKQILQNAELEYNDFDSKYRASPEKLLSQYRQEGDDVFRPRLEDAVFRDGVRSAEKRYDRLENIYKYYAARYAICVCRANLLNDEYTSIREAGVLYVAQLRSIYNKLTEKQKKREIKNAAESLRIAAIDTNQIKTTDHIAGLMREQKKYREKTNDAIFKEYPAYRESFESKGVAAGTFLASVIVGNLFANYDDRKEIKKKLENACDTLLVKIEFIEERRLTAEAFILRAEEINKALRKAIEVYKKQYNDVYSFLYSSGDKKKTIAARLENQYNGKNYFDENEAVEVVQLGQTAQFLLELVDAPL